MTFNLDDLLAGLGAFAAAAGKSSSNSVTSSDGTTILTLTSRRTASGVTLRLTVSDQHGRGLAGQTVAGQIEVTGLGPPQQRRFLPTDAAGQSAVTIPFVANAAAVQVRVDVRRGGVSVVLTTVVSR